MLSRWLAHGVERRSKTDDSGCSIARGKEHEAKIKKMKESEYPTPIDRGELGTEKRHGLALA
jgi:hypothetical protein